MAKIRVGQLAKELNLKVSEILARLHDLGVEAKTNLSTVEDEMAGRLRASMPPAAPKPAEAVMPKKVAAKPAAPHGAGAGDPAMRSVPKPPVKARPAAAPVNTAAAKSSVTPSAALPRPSAAQVTTPAGSKTPPSAAGRISGPPRHPATAVPARPQAPAGAPGAAPAPPKAGIPVRNYATTTIRPAAPGVPPRPQVPGSLVRPAVTKGPATTSTRPGQSPSTATRPVSGTVTGQRPGVAAPARPLVGVGQPQRGPRPGGLTSPVPSSTGARPVAGSRPGTTPTPLRPAGRVEPARHQAGATASSATAASPSPRPHAVPPPPPRPAVPSPPVIPDVLQEITITEGVTVKELSEKMDRKAKDIITRLLGRGIMSTINQPLDVNMAKEICREFGFDAKVISFEEEVSLEQTKEAEPADLRPRDPVVTIMGHVDHGKTSLLDAIRESNIAGGEAGGITQHIGAYHIRRKERGITFIDTPGHEAFTMMRARGARVTDIVVLVVAADDGVMPQTIEAVHHARAAGVPLVVAINKMDKPGANLDRVKKQLSDQGLLVEDWGGDVVAVPISAKQKLGINELLEMILLVADIGELKADPSSLASGVVLDARLDRSRGPVATVLVQRGTLRIGDPFIAGAIHGKVRAMFDDLGHRAREAGPSIPVEVLGLEGVPEAGNPFQVLEDEWKVRQIGAFRQQKLRQEAMAKSSRLTLDHLYQQIKEGTVKELPLVVKADVQGSVEALAKSLNDLPSDKVKIKTIHAGSGAITETDVHLASASNAIIIGYNVRPERSAQELAEKEKVDIRLHSVIYDITNEIKNAMLGLLDPEAKEVYLGRADVRQVFKVPKVGTVAGTYVSDGKITRSAEVRLLRDNVVVYTGKVASLRRFKDDASEVKSGYECGIGLANFNDVKIGDVIEAFKVEKIAVKTL
jgi:translation initiation factor IF-2